MTTAFSAKHTVLWAGIMGLVVAGAVAMLAGSSQAGEAVLVRGIVKPGGASDSINIYITHVATAADASKIQGIRTDVDVTKAKKYKWQEKSGNLQKVRTTANPTPEQEVVVYGTLLSDNRITAAWTVHNYREFTIEGTVQAVTLDTGFTDQGYITINVTSSKLRDVVPAHPFKETILKGKDLRIRVNGSTTITALGKSKLLDEVPESQQKIRIEGQMLDANRYAASTVNEF